MKLPHIKKKKLFKRILIGFIYPTFTVSLYFLFRTSFLDNIFFLPPLILIAVFVFYHTVIGGLWSGLYTTYFFTFTAVYLYIPPLYGLVFTPNDTVRLNVALFTGGILSFLITKLQRDKQTLKLNKKKLERIMESVFNIVIIIDKSGRIIDVNESYSNLLNCTTSSLIGKHLCNFEPWVSDIELSTEVNNRLNLAKISGQERFETSIEINNKRMYVEIVIKTIDFKNPDELVITVRDRTDKKLYENELAKGQAVLDKLVQSNIIGMILSDKQGNIIEANDKYISMLGYTKDEFNQTKPNWGRFTAPEFVNISKEKSSLLIKNGYMDMFEKEYIHKDGHRVPVLISGIAVNKDQALCLILDVTPQKTLQLKKDEFISLASHELKTPMTIIKGYLQLLSKKMNSEKEEYRSFISIIDFQINKLNSIVNELHDMSKIEASKLRINVSEINLNDLIRNTIKEVKPFTDTHDFEFNEQVENIILNADLIRLEQVLINLLTNAIKYSPGGDKIIVSLREVNNNAIIEIEDFGIGIADNDIKNIFTKYFQVDEHKEHREGLGLGLYISNKIINLHQGDIKIESEFGKGSKFIVTIPIK